MATKNTTVKANGTTKGKDATKAKGKAKDATKAKGKGVAVATKGKTVPAPTSFKLATTGKKGSGTAVSATGADGVVRTRAQWNGYSLSGLLKWVGFNGGTIQNARQLVSALGLEDVTSASTVSCQFYSGVAQNTKGAKVNHAGKPADVSKEHRGALKALCGM